jgi:MFS family permease
MNSGEREVTDLGRARVRAAEIAVVRTAAVVQGLALVTVPTLGTVLTDPAHFALSQTAYGSLFVPQSILAVVFSLAGGRLTQRFGIKRIVMTGFAANALSMGLLVASARFAGNGPITYGALLCATAALGFGFAILTPALNVLAGAFDPRKIDRAILIVNALLGAAAALAPVLLIVFVGLGFWWGLPLLAGVAMIALFAASARLPFDVTGARTASTKPRIPARFWVFAAFAFAYGLCEQMNGTWAPIYVTMHLGAAASFGLLALALFWGFAAAARVVFAVFEKLLPPTIVFRVLPLLLALAFVVLAAQPMHAAPISAEVAFALAGLGASALLPLVISFCQRSIPEAATSVTSLVFAIYLMGYGCAAYGAGPLQRYGLGLPILYGASALLALVAGGVAFAIVGVLDRGTRSSEPSAQDVPALGSER